MTHERRTTEDALRSWGEAVRQLPAHAETRRAAAMRAAPASASEHRARMVRPRAPWFALAFATLAVVAIAVRPERFLRIPSSDVPERLASQLAAPTRTPASVPSRSEAYVPEFGTATGLSTRDIRDSFLGRLLVPGAADEIPVRDARELIETDYAAQARVRRVADASARVQTIIRGHRGRVDAETTSETYASITFAIPATELDRVRSELRSIAGTRFFTERTSSVNRLPEQVNYERMESTAAETIAQLERDRTDRIAAFRKVEAQYLTRVRTLYDRRQQLREQLRATLDADTRTAIETQIHNNEQTAANAHAAFGSKRTAHDREIQAIDERLFWQREQLESAQTAQVNLAERVATVRGTITLNDISLIGQGATYLGDHWIALLLGVLAILAFVRMDRRPLIA